MIAALVRPDGRVLFIDDGDRTLTS